MADEVVGDLQGGVDTSQQQVDGSSSDEYDPQAVQTDYISTPRAKDPSVQSLSFDTVVPNTLPHTFAAPLDPTSSSTNLPLIDNATMDRQSFSRSMSRASSQSSDEVEITTIVHDSSQSLSKNAEEVTAARKISGDNSADTAHILSLDPVPDPCLTVPTNAVSSDKVQVQNNVSDQSPSKLTQNGVTNTVPKSAAIVPDTGASFHNETTTKPTGTLAAPSATNGDLPVVNIPSTPITSVPRARLPHDKIGILEDRIKEDLRGDLNAWLSLLDEHKKRGKFDDARTVYERFFEVFPSAAEEWTAYGHMENESGKANAMDNVLFRALPTNPYLPLWSMYLDHVRRHNNLTTDVSGDARQVIYQAYDVALKHIGLDKEAGKVWQDYVNFIKSGPGNIGGSGWQDQQKMDSLRKIYQRAICIPHQFTNLLWKEYDGFEMGLNKMTGRKFLQDQSPSYMSARSSYTELQNITRNLHRTTLPVLPPAPGFDGDVEYAEQLDIWMRWIQWEKDDPLVLKQDDVASYRERILFVYKHALMAMRFWPDLWCEASDFCFANNLESEGNDFLTHGIAANPESCLLAFKRADRIELSTTNEEGDESAVRRGAAVREPYDGVLDALYELIAKSKLREAQELARIESSYTDSGDHPSNGAKPEDDNELGEQDEDEDDKEKQRAAQLEAVKNSYAIHTQMLSKTLSHVWIALIRAMRRIQGKGKVNDTPAGLRGTFADARKRGRITSDVYSACALIEFHCYEVETGKKIFERGLKLFPEDETFALQFIKHLVANNDHTNARVTFETAVNKLAQKPETVSKAKPLYVFFHDFESRYGELSQIVKLEKRMKALFPDDPTLAKFSSRFVEQGFDPTVIRPIVSPATQTKIKAIPSIENGTLAQGSPPNRFNPDIPSPKRPLPLEDSDNEGGRPQKLARTTRDVSPLKGAAGRRLDQQKRSRQQPEMPLFSNKNNNNDQLMPIPPPPPPPPLPRDVMFLLSIIPKAETYHATKFSAEALVRLIHDTHIPPSMAQLPPPPMSRGPPPSQQMPLYQPNPPMQTPMQAPMQTQMQPPMHGQYNGQFNGRHRDFSSAPAPFSHSQTQSQKMSPQLLERIRRLEDRLQPRWPSECLGVPQSSID